MSNDETKSDINQGSQDSETKATAQSKPDDNDDKSSGFTPTVDWALPAEDAPKKVGVSPEQGVSEKEDVQPEDEALTEEDSKIQDDIKKDIIGWMTANGIKGDIDCIHKKSSNEFTLRISQCDLSSLPEPPRAKKKGFIKYDAFYQRCMHLVVETSELDMLWDGLFSKLTNLKRIDLKGVGQSIEDFNFSNEHLESVVLNNISIGKLPKWLLGKNNLRHLNISKTRIKSLPDTLPPSLISLNVSETPLAMLPNLTESLENLKLLNIARTAIVDIPQSYLPPNLKTLLIGERAVTSIPTAVYMCPNLKILSLAGTNISALQGEVSFIESLECLDLGSTNITKLPDWLAEAENLNYLGLSDLSLETFNEKVAQKLFIKRKLKIYDQALKWKYQAFDVQPVKGYETEERGVFISGLQIRDMDVRYLQLNSSEFLSNYFNENKAENREIQIIFGGDTGPESRKLICDILGEKDTAHFQDAVGFLKYESHFLEDASGRPLLPRNSKISYILLDERDVYQAAHHLFVGDSNLYIIFLDGRKKDTIKQEAIKRAEFADLYSPWSKMLFVVNYSKDERDLHFFMQFSMVNNIHISVQAVQGLIPESDLLGTDVDYDPDSFDYDDRLEAIVKKIAETIHNMPEYTRQVPAKWKKARSYLSELLAVKGVISRGQYEEVLNIYAITIDAVKKHLVRWFGETGVCIKEKSHSDYEFRVLLSPVKTAIAVYTALELSERNNGVVTIRKLLDRLNELDVSADWPFTEKDIDNAVTMLESAGLCTTLESVGHCAVLPGKMGRDDRYFPVNGKYTAKGDDKQFINPWELNGVTDFVSNAKHYIVEFEYLPNILISSILIGLFSCDLMKKHLNDDLRWNQSYVGCDGAFWASRDGEFRLIIRAQPGVKGHLDIYDAVDKGFARPSGGEGPALAKIILEVIKPIFLDLPANSRHQYRFYIDYRQDNMSARISIGDLLGYLRADQKEFLLPELNVNINMASITTEYKIDKTWRLYDVIV